MKADYENGIVRERDVTYGTPNAVAPMAASSSQQYCLSLYNREAAKNYANANYNNPDAFGLYLESTVGNCTNFTSRCLKAGGIKEDKSGSYQWYFTNANDRAPAWTGANYFRNYYRNNVGSASTFGLMAGQCSLQETLLGDLVQFIGNGEAYHTMIITGYLLDNWAVGLDWEYKRDVLIAQNSANDGGQASSQGRLCNYPLGAKNISPKNTEYVQIIGCWS